MKQLTSAYSPSNFPATNPEVLRETLATNAQNLLNGANLLAEDLKQSGDLMKISQTDPNAFELGRNLATTPGKIVSERPSSAHSIFADHGEGPRAAADHGPALDQ